MDVSVIVATFEGCDPKQINDRDFVKRLLSEAAEAGKFTVLHTYIHSFDPQGLTGSAVLAESHINLHSWPETGALFVDMATCSGAEATQAAFDTIARLVNHQRVLPHSITCYSKPARHYSPLMNDQNPLNKTLLC